VPERKRRSIALRCKPGIHLPADRGTPSSASTTKPPATAARPKRCPAASSTPRRSIPTPMPSPRSTRRPQRKNSGAARCRAESGHDGLNPRCARRIGETLRRPATANGGPKLSISDPTPAHPLLRSAEWSAGPRRRPPADGGQHLGSDPFPSLPAFMPHVLIRGCKPAPWVCHDDRPETFACHSGGGASERTTS
jgi:hypothetical protein